MTVDLVVRNGNLVLPNGVVKADVIVEGGKIAALTKDSSSVKADTTIDAKDKYVLPGAIDPHVHFGIYSGSFEKDVGTETRAMALGGVTTPVHYLQENGSYLKILGSSAKAVKDKALVDVAFQVILMNQGHLNEMPMYPDRGISAGKIYMNGKEYKMIGIDSDVDDAFLYRAFNLCNKLGFLPKLHCENYELAKAIGESVRGSGQQGLPAWDAFRPSVCEEEAMRRAYLIAGHTGTRFYIVHNTTAAAERLSEQAVSENREVWFETCPHYLTFTKDDEIGILGKVNPPIRSEEDRESLWNALKRGLIHTIGSDHAPNMLSAKKGKGDIWTALLGFGGSSFIFPTLFTEGVEKRGLPLTTVARVTSFNASRTHGISSKGLLAPGYDADVVVIDAKRYRKVEPAMVQSYADYTLYDGRKMTGWPAYTISGGRVVAQDLDIVGKPGVARVARCDTAKAG